MKKGSKLRLTFNKDGSVSIDGSGLIGTDAELTADLEDLAREMGGELKVEKHIHHGHTHSHDHGSDHLHGRK